MPVQIEVRDAWLDDGEMSLVIDFDNTVHSLEVDDDAAGQIRRRPAVAEVLACRDWKEWNLRAVRDLDNLGHLLSRVRRHGRGDESLVGLAPERRVRIPIQRDVFVAREDSGRTHSLLELFQSGVPISLTDT
jgi:hypothetical protein